MECAISYMSRRTKIKHCNTTAIEGALVNMRASDRLTDLVNVLISVIELRQGNTNERTLTSIYQLKRLKHNKQGPLAYRLQAN